MDKEYYKHWVFGENNLGEKTQVYLINLKVGISIRFNYEDSVFASFEEFYESIADVQFIYGARPEKEKADQILTEAWNFLCLEEKQFLLDLEDDEAFEDF